MAALLKPQPAYDIVKTIKESLDEQVRIHVHVHATTGVTLVSLMKAIEAGADVVDTSISSLSLGPGHNPTESLVENFSTTLRSTVARRRRAQSDLVAGVAFAGVAGGEAHPENGECRGLAHVALRLADIQITAPTNFDVWCGTAAGVAAQRHFLCAQERRRRPR